MLQIEPILLLKRAQYGRSDKDRAAGGRAHMLEAGRMLTLHWAAPAHRLPSLAVVELKILSARCFASLRSETPESFPRVEPFFFVSADRLCGIATHVHRATWAGRLSASAGEALQDAFRAKP